MREVYVIRHAEKDWRGELTPAGERAALAARSMLPGFDVVVASGARRAVATAALVAGREPRVDARAGFDADQPRKLRELIDGLLARLAEGQRALVVSHEPIIALAGEGRMAPIGALGGFVVDESGQWRPI